MKIAFLARFDLNDLTRGSGTFYYMIRAMRAQGHEVTTYDPVNPPVPLVCRVRNRIHRGLMRRIYRADLDIDYARLIGRIANWQTREFRGDVVITNDNCIAAFYGEEKPIVLITDAVLQAVIDSHGWQAYRNLCPPNLRMGRMIQELALKNVSGAFFPTSWACMNAIQHHHGDPKKIWMVRWGANLEDVPRENVIRQRRPPSRRSCHLLFVGRDWVHKGGPCLLDVVRHLKRDGVHVKLTIVGCQPAPRDLPGFVELEPYLDKRNEGERRRLEDLYSHSHFLVVPSQGEGYGIVFAEAAAYGLPSISYRHTGIASSVADGTSGVLLETNARGETIAKRILRLLDNPSEYRDISLSSRLFFETEVNWPTAVSRIMGRIGEIHGKDERRVAWRR